MFCSLPEFIYISFARKQFVFSAGESLVAELNLEIGKSEQIALQTLKRNVNFRHTYVSYNLQDGVAGNK